MSMAAVLVLSGDAAAVVTWWRWADGSALSGPQTGDG